MNKPHDHTIFYIKSGDLLPELEILLLDCEGLPLDLTPYLAGQMRIVIASCVGGRRIVSDAPVSQKSGTLATDGKVVYQWQPGETDEPGDYLLEVVLTPDALDYATLTIGGAALNDAVTYTAKQPGVDGNNVRVSHALQPASSALVITVSGNDITVNLGMDVNGAVASTASQVKAAVDASTAASALVGTAVEGTGADIAVTQAPTNLSGGTDQRLMTLPGGAYGRIKITSRL